MVNLLPLSQPPPKPFLGKDAVLVGISPDIGEMVPDPYPEERVSAWVNDTAATPVAVFFSRFPRPHHHPLALNTSPRTRVYSENHARSGVSLTSQALRSARCSSLLIQVIAFILSENFSRRAVRYAM